MLYIKLIYLCVTFSFSLFIMHRCTHYLSVSQQNLACGILGHGWYKYGPPDKYCLISKP